MITGIVASQQGLVTVPPGGGVTWSPSDKHADITLSNGNLTATTTASNQYRVLRASLGRDSGKYYFECRVDVAGDPNEMAPLGLASATSTLSNFLGSQGSTNFSAGYFADGRVWQNGAGATDTGMPIQTSVSDWAGIAVDFDDGLAWVRSADGWDGDPETGSLARISFGPNTTLFPAACLYAVSDQVTANFGATSFAFSIPSGFLAWSAE